MAWILLIAVLVAVSIVAAFVVAHLKQQSGRMGVLETKLGIAVKPFWGYSLSVMAELLVHPHERYKEADILIHEALLEPAVRMTEERHDRLDALLDARYLDKTVDMRPGENDAAMAFKHGLRMVRIESENKVALSDFTVVGRKEPLAQRLGDEPELV